MSYALSLYPLVTTEGEGTGKLTGGTYLFTFHTFYTFTVTFYCRPSYYTKTNA